MFFEGSPSLLTFDKKPFKQALTNIATILAPGKHNFTDESQTQWV